MIERNVTKENKLVDNAVKGSYILLSILLGSYLAVQSFRTIVLTQEKVAIFHTAEEEVNSLRLKNIELILKNEKVTSEVYVEAEARNRLNYVKDGETVFIISEEVIKNHDLELYVKSFYPSYIDESRQNNFSSISVWIKLFQEGL